MLAADAHPTLPLPVNRIGHQGLFFERLTTGSVDAPMLAVGARGLYHSRNCWLHVELGRFLTRDPAEAAMPIITALAFNGQLAGETPALPFSPTGHYADGFNLYQFVGSSPVNRMDPLGLEWGMEDETDDLVNDLIGHKLYALGTLNEGAKWASLGLNTALNIAGALLGVDVFQSVCLIWSGQGGFWDAMNIVASLNPVGRLGKIGGILGKGIKWLKRGARGADEAIGAFKAFTHSNFRHNLKVLSKFDAPKNIQAHHMLPIKYESEFKAAGINNIHDPKWGAWWAEGAHQSDAYRYNQVWDRFFQEHAGAGIGEIEAEARRLANQFGLAVNF